MITNARSLSCDYVGRFDLDVGGALWREGAAHQYRHPDFSSLVLSNFDGWLSANTADARCVNGRARQAGHI